VVNAGKDDMSGIAERVVVFRAASGGMSVVFSAIWVALSMCE